MASAGSVRYALSAGWQASRPSKWPQLALLVLQQVRVRIITCMYVCMYICALYSTVDSHSPQHLEIISMRVFVAEWRFSATSSRVLFPCACIGIQYRYRELARFTWLGRHTAHI